MKIVDRQIGKAFPPFVIAEISANHNGKLEAAKKLISLAKESGADAVKLQTYRADTLTINCDASDFQIKDGLWSGKSLYQLYEQAHTPWEWHPDLFKFAADEGIIIFSSPFDASAVDLLEELGCPAYKIASFEIGDLELIAYAASKGKPLIISTGLAELEEITNAVAVAKASGAADVALLHCLSAYPAPPSEYKLESITRLRDEFGVEVGLSDHTIGNTVAISAVALGASIVEKHFTLDRTGGGPDDSFSMDTTGLKDLRRCLDEAWGSLGFDNYSVQPSEIPSLKYKRSIYFVEDLLAGETISRDNVRVIRPGYGLAPKYLSEILGKRTIGDVSRGQAVSFEDIDWTS